ncbi:ead/Ea22-like family protein [Kluyvera ascorbata]|uniref:ead/Ea22-like family protein n=1 Tax=Kluyvera ascorbata TaxID=51288 RepID=UPI002431D0F7|nr:ead/Ea22-like family protein [Kluyvera ascorbata]
MNDITALMATMKAAAEKATPGEWSVQFGDEVYATDGVENEQIAIATNDARDADFIALANPANVRALVEALEKAQQQTTESENRVRKQNRHICELFDDNTALRQRIASLEESHAQVIQSRDHYKRMSEEGLKQLVESRTVTVKWPTPKDASQGWKIDPEFICKVQGAIGYDEEEGTPSMEVIEAVLLAAGIQVIEGDA